MAQSTPSSTRNVAGPSFGHPKDDDCDAGIVISTPPSSTSPSSILSSPLSMLSNSPSLPGSPPHDAGDPSGRYPSPSASSIPSGPQSPQKPPHADREIRVSTAAAAADGPPPPKKRKIAQPKPRTTEYLDLTSPALDDKTSDEAAQLERLLKVIRKKKKIVVIAGAGISVSAGIPDFRSNEGLFATLKSQHNLKGSGKHLFDAGVYRHDSSTHSFHTMVRELAALTRGATPTPFHHLLASLAAEGRLLRLYTQNVDCIDTSLGPLATTVPLCSKGPWPVTVQLHGGLEKMVCTKCGALAPFDGDKFTSHEAPLCGDCEAQEHVRINFSNKRSQGVGRMRPRIVLYNEPNPDEDAIGSVSMADLRSRPDAVLVVGTSLKIPGVRRLVRELCHVTRGRRDGFTAWLNVDPVPPGAEFRDCWDLVVKGLSDDVASLAQLPRWDDDEGVRAPELSEAEARESEKMLKRSKLEVHLSPKKKAAAHDQGMPTPGASPMLSAVGAPAKTQSKLSFAKGAASGTTTTTTTTSTTATTTAAASRAAKSKKKKAPSTRVKLPDKPRAGRKPGVKREAAREHTTVKDAFRTVKAVPPSAAGGKGAKVMPVSAPEKKRVHAEFMGAAAAEHDDDDADDSDLSSLGSLPDVSMLEGVLPPLRPGSVY